MQTIVGVRFSKLGKLYHFEAGTAQALKIGEHVLVDTVRGRQIGKVVQLPEKTPPRPEGGWRAVERRATTDDLALQQSWQGKQTEAMIACRARASELGLANVKIVAAEYTYDGGRLVFLFSTEEDDRPDLKSLRKDMQAAFPKSQVDLRQIGPRDVARLLGGMGACGIETRCCSKFLTEFSPISIKMAKEQGISLAPTEIAGMCGRLRCCLIYEYEQYVEARKHLPKRNKQVVTPNGRGKVLDIQPMSNRVTVLLEGEEDKRRVETFDREQIEPWDELEALRRKASGGCDKHQGGGCTCGSKTPNAAN